MRRRGVRIVGTRAYNKFRRKFRLPLPMVQQCAGLLDEDDEESGGESEIESESDREDE